MSRHLTVALLTIATLAAPARAQHPERAVRVAEGTDFQVYGPAGEARSLGEVLAAMDSADAVLVGEFHTDDVGHRVERELLLRAAERFGVVAEGAPAFRPLVVSLEFFERDVQLALDEYLAGLISEDQFLDVGRPWDNYDDDYRPLVEFARAHAIPVVAANAPRRYVNRVTRLGPGSLEDLPEEARAFLPPLPYPGPSEEYRAQFMAEMMEGMVEGMAEEDEPGVPTDRTGQPAPPDHGMGYALQSQALWDAAMSHAIGQALDESPGALLIHYVGGFHVAHHTGIPEQVLYYRPGTRVMTISMEPVEDIGAWNEDEYGGMADFVILTQAPPPHEEKSAR